MRRPGLTVGLLAVCLSIPAGWLWRSVSLAQTGPSGAPSLRVVTKPIEPFVIPQGDRSVGFSIDLLDQLAKRVGFSYQLHSVNSVADQLSELQHGQADLAIAAISITRTREHAVDFCVPMYSSGLQVMVPAAGSDRPSLLRASRSLWRPTGAILILLLVVAHIAWLIESRENPEHFPKPYLEGIGEGLWWGSVTLTTVGYGDRTPRSFWGRLLAVVWMLTAIVLIANLTARITTAFTVQQLRSAINGPDDLAGRRVATVRGTTSSDYLKGRDQSPIEVDSIAGAYRLLANHDVAAVVFDSPALLYYANTKGKGAVKVVGPVFDHQDYGIAVPLGSTMRKPINEALLALVEDGTYLRIQKTWFGPS